LEDFQKVLLSFNLWGVAFKDFQKILLSFDLWGVTFKDFQRVLLSFSCLVNPIQFEAFANPISICPMKALKRHYFHY